MTTHFDALKAKFPADNQLDIQKLLSNLPDASYKPSHALPLPSLAQPSLSLPSCMPVFHVHITAPAGFQCPPHSASANPNITQPPFAHFVYHHDSQPASRTSSSSDAETAAACRVPSTGSTYPQQPSPANPRSSKPRSKPNAKPVFWTPEDHDKFLQGLAKFGLQESLGADGADLMAIYMGNRTRLQVRSHAQKYYAAKARAKAVSE